ncbi:V-type proton ATPase subunit e 2 [Portunus trituberculatus]|uniref:V-type proton ATPase subunit e 2 n=1 Tax=Portunus trituberculatus TaxID=210409 RepID=A0A5B7EUN4_PORTR|nr:V-type proton ATPase subunit e 2 [Portunus trituberculatus]
MGADAVPVSVMTAFFGVVGVVLPFIVAKGPNRGWLLAYMHQMNPLIGPQLVNTTVIALQYLWDHNLVLNVSEKLDSLLESPLT